MRGYANVYFAIGSDERLARIFPDDALLGLWLRLLILAEQAWPEPAYLPRSVTRRKLAVFLEAGVLELVDADRFRFHGLDAERTRRVEHGKAAADARWSARGDAPSITPSSAQAMHARAGAVPPPSTSSSLPPRELSSSLPAREGASPDDGPLLWLSRHKAGIPEGNGLHVKLIGLCERHGPEKVIAAWEAMPPGTGRTYVLGAENVLDVIVRAPAPKDERAAEAAAESKRRLAATQRQLAELRGAT